MRESPGAPSGYTDQGAGCCESGDFAANSMYSGNSDGLDECAAKCDANPSCGYVSYGWAGSTWCGLLKAQTLKNVNSGATACGSSGSNGVHCYAHAARSTMSTQACFGMLREELHDSGRR